MCDLNFIYGIANGNALAARRFYAESYPNRTIPHHTFTSASY